MNDDEDTPLQIRETKKDIMIWAATLSTVFGILILISYTYNFLQSQSNSTITTFGAFGDFIGGFIGTLFSLSGFFLLYLTLKEQRDNFDKERLENNFFEMIKFHKENVSELEFSYHETGSDDSKVKAVKRKVFKIIFSQIKDLWMELDFLFEEKHIANIYNEASLLKFQNDETVISRNIDLKQLAKIDIVFLIVFFGLGKDDKLTIANLTKETYSEKFIFDVLNFSSLKPKRNSRVWGKWDLFSQIENPDLKDKVIEDFFKKRNNTFEKNETTFEYFDTYHLNMYYEDNYEKYYGGHQFRLAHYFRIFFQNVTYINNQIYLNYENKYGYVKLLRVHLSNYEQIILFFNSLSLVGRNLEIAQPDINNQLITKYNLIKNIPNETIFETISLKNYYPKIDYETFTSNLIGRKELIQFFK